MDKTKQFTNRSKNPCGGNKAEPPWLGGGRGSPRLQRWWLQAADGAVTGGHQRQQIPAQLLRVGCAGNSPPAVNFALPGEEMNLAISDPRPASSASFRGSRKADIPARDRQRR